MNTHFLTEIEIKQFKCFTDFKAAGFNRVNLIGGKNNIGKTALMDAIFINTRSKDIEWFINSLLNVQVFRETANFIPPVIKKLNHYIYLESCKVYEAKSNLINQKFSISVKQLQKECHFSVGNQSEKIVLKPDIHIDIDFVENNIRYLHKMLSDFVVADLFKAIQEHNKEIDLENFIKPFDDSIQHFKVFGTQPRCEVNGIYRDISEFGDGLKSYISIICALYACENGYLFIDEIDNGIYYDHFDRLWEIIFTLSKQMNCQVFATTHSKEMLESFARVAKKMDEQDISFTTLVKNKKQEIKSFTYGYEMVLNSLSDGRELRG